MKRNPCIVHFISSLERGGAQTVLADIIMRLPHYQHHVMYFHGGAYEHWYAQHAIPLHRVRGFVHTYDPLVYVRIVQILRRIAPDLLHTSLWAANWVGRIAGRLLGIPTVMALHNRAELNGSVRMFFDGAAPSAQRIVAVSDDVRNTFQATYHAPVQVICNGVEIPRTEHGHTVRMQWGLDGTAFVIGAVGRLHAIKRFDLLIRSFARLCERYATAHLVIIGTGGEQERLRTQIMDQGLHNRVHLITGQDARLYYGSFDCFVLPSACEGVSMALLEAMGAGLACIVTHDGATHPVITSGYDGLLCAGSEAALGTAIESLLCDAQRRKDFGMQAQKTVVNRFSVERMTQAYDQLFISLICPKELNSI